MAEFLLLAVQEPNPVGKVVVMIMRTHMNILVIPGLRAWVAAMRYPRYPWIPQILEPVCKFIHRPVCMLFYVLKFQRSSSNGSEMAAL
jgi:hypothetical protein